MAQQKSTRNQPGAIVRRFNQRNLLIGFVLTSLLALGVFIFRTSSRSTIASVDRADVQNVALVARGQQIYMTRCATCHGSDLQGEQGWPQRSPNGVMPASPLDQSGQAWQRDEQWLFTTIKHGGQATAPPGEISSMPAFGGGLTDTDIWAVISYIKSTWPQNIQEPLSRME